MKDKIRKCYINGVGCVSAQPTLEEEFLKKPVSYAGKSIFPTIKPKYKSFIPPAMIRRMSGGVKNSIVASKKAMEEAGVEKLDAIITGTGLGCIQDSEKFLNKLLDNEEQYLTPTSFIQSTHNTVAGQIALGLECKSYNVTYVHAGTSFPSALLDGLMKIEEGQHNILVGGVDELSTYTSKLYQLISHYKEEGEVPQDILKERSIGCIPGEGATFFVLDSIKNKSSYAELLDIHYVNQLGEGGLPSFITSFLTRNNCSTQDLGAVLLGNNGDSQFDIYYDEVEETMGEVPFLYYKHLFGEYMSSPSIATWLAAKILKEQAVPTVLFKEEPKEWKNIRYILIYNQYRGKDHSLMLLKNV